jgi:hypothetical protein
MESSIIHQDQNRPILSLPPSINRTLEFAIRCSSSAEKSTTLERRASLFSKCKCLSRFGRSAAYCVRQTRKIESTVYPHRDAKRLVGSAACIYSRFTIIYSAKIAYFLSRQAAIFISCIYCVKTFLLLCCYIRWKERKR